MEDSGMRLLASALLILVLMGAGEYLLGSLPQGATGSHPKTTVGGGGGMPPNSGVRFELISNAILENVSASNQLNLSYSGYMENTQLGASAPGQQPKLPLAITYLKYGQNAARLTINTVSQIIGNFSMVDIRAENGTYFACLSMPGALAGAALNASNTPKGVITAGYSCQGASNFMASISSSFSFPNITGGNWDGIYVSRRGDATHRGAPCTLFSGVGSENVTAAELGFNINETFVYNVSMCLSKSGLIPLNITLGLEQVSQYAAPVQFSAVLNETAMGAPATLAEVSSMPGPMVNATPGYGAAPGMANRCSSLSNYTCANVTVSGKALLNATVVQQSGYTLYNVEMACVSGGGAYGTKALYEAIGQNGSVVGGGAGSPIASGAPVSIRGLFCPALEGSVAPGAEAYGSLLINYTSKPGTVGPLNKRHTIPFAVFFAKMQD